LADRRVPCQAPADPVLNAIIHHPSRVGGVPKRRPRGWWQSRARRRGATLAPCRKGRDHMRIVALEEHFTVPELVGRIDPEAIRRRGFPGPDVVWGQVIKRNELRDLGAARLADMDASGITVQVLSVSGPGADLVPGEAGI